MNIEDAIIKVLTENPKLLEKVYTDSLSSPLQQTGELATDIIKTVQLLTPFMYLAAARDLLKKRLNNAINKVPKENRVKPVNSLLLQISEKLAYEDESSTIADLYINLLSRAMNKEKVDEAHPSFIFTISQLAPIEIEIIKSMYESKIKFLLIEVSPRKLASQRYIDDYLSHAPLAGAKATAPQWFNQCEIDQPEIFLTLIDHLVTLGLATRATEAERHSSINMYLRKIYNEVKVKFEGYELTGMGTLFFKACIQE